MFKHIAIIVWQLISLMLSLRISYIIFNHIFKETLLLECQNKKKRSPTNIPIFPLIILLGYFSFTIIATAIIIVENINGPDPTWWKGKWENVLTILGIGLSVGIASLSFFFPLLVGFWSAFLKGFLEMLTKLDELRQREQIDHDKVGSLYEHVDSTYSEVLEIAERDKRTFQVSIVLALVLVLLHGVAFFIPACKFGLYFVYILLALVITMFLWFMSLLSKFVWEMQPKSSEIDDKYRALLIELNNGGLK